MRWGNLTWLSLAAWRINKCAVLSQTWCALLLFEQFHIYLSFGIHFGIWNSVGTRFFFHGHQKLINRSSIIFWEEVIWDLKPLCTPSWSERCFHTETSWLLPFQGKKPRDLMKKERRKRELLGECSVRIHRPVLLSCLLAAVLQTEPINLHSVSRKEQCQELSLRSPFPPPDTVRAGQQGDVAWEGEGTQSHPVCVCALLFTHQHTHTHTRYINLTLSLLERKLPRRKTHVLKCSQDFFS